MGPPEDIYKTLTHIPLFTFPGENSQGIYGRNIFTHGIMYAVKEERRITSMTTCTPRVIKYNSFHVEDTYRKWLTGNIQLGPIDIKRVISHMPSIHPTVAMELVYRAVLSNKIIYNRYMREGNGKLHLVRDPTTPFFSVYNPNVDSLDVQYKTMISVKPLVGPFDKKTAKRLICLDADKKVKFLRNMQYMDRVSLVERMFKALFINYGRHLYHIMCYRIPGDAYTAVFPIPKPKILQNKMRILDNGIWRYVDALDPYSESHIISALVTGHSKGRSRDLVQEYNTQVQGRLKKIRKICRLSRLSNINFIDKYIQDLPVDFSTVSYSYDWLNNGNKKKNPAEWIHRDRLLVQKALPLLRD